MKYFFVAGLFVLVGFLQAESSPAPVPIPASAQSDVVIKPQVSLIPAPLKPSVIPVADQSVMMSCSPSYNTPAGGGVQDILPLYQPVRKGGFSINGGARHLHRPIAQGQNHVLTGDVPLFRMETCKESISLWLPKAGGAAKGLQKHSMGTLRLGVVGQDGRKMWLDSLVKTTTVTFFPGYTDYQVASPAGDWKANIRVAPVSGSHGLICRVEFDREMALIWQYGDVWLADVQPRGTEVTVKGSEASFVDANLPNGMVLAGWDGEGKGQKTVDGQSVEFTATKPRRLYYIVAVWGVNEMDQKVVEEARANLIQTPAAQAWPKAAEELWQSWLDCYVNPALKPEQHFRSLLAAPAPALERTISAWTARRNEFQIRTPDEHLDALINWAQAVSEYHRQGPGCYLNINGYFYTHISMDWWGKEWSGDHAAIEEMLRLYAIGQEKAGPPITKMGWGLELPAGGGGSIGWLGWRLNHYLQQEDNTPYWVEQVWQHYRWTGNRQFVVELWPFIQKAVAWETANCDPDGTGLFYNYYPILQADSFACLAKSASATALAWTMLDSAARLAEVVGNKRAAADYQAHADKCRAAADRELWDDQAGLLRSIGSDGLRLSHPNSWEESMAVNLGLLDPARGRRVMRWVESQYGFEGTRPDVRLTMTSDLWPLRWSNQYVSVGDILLNALAAMKSGDVDLWWPYVNTAVHSSFRAFVPGIHYGISNAGMGIGDLEDVDTDDTPTHMAVRGLFGIEPALHEGKLYICPAFPAGWKQASIKMPDVSYDFQREGDEVTFHIRTPKPLVKHVRANLTGREVITVAETESVVKATVGPALPELPKPTHPSSILADRQPLPKPAPLSDAQKQRLVMFDLSGTYNITQEQLMTTPFLFDDRRTPMPAKDWWVNPSLKLTAGPREIETAQGVMFLTAGRPQGVDASTAPKGLLALSSWKPYPWPAGARIPVARPCERLWLLLQNYVHPSKCYVPNGEVVLHYAGGKTGTTSLIPPYNMDCFYQQFSREGETVPLGEFDHWPPKKGYSPATAGAAEKYTVCHAVALEIACDPQRLLESVELRATCSEGILGLAGMTILTPQAKP